MKKLLLLIIVVFYLTACKDKETAVPESFYYQYFPHYTNAEYIYRTDTFFYNDFTNTIDTFSGFLKYKTVSVSKDNEDRDNYIIHTYYRRSDTLNWEPVNVWSSLLDKNKNRAERFTNNNKYVPLSFPVRERKSWDCNVLNLSDPGDCRYIEIHHDFDNGYFNSDSVLTVEMLNDSNFINHNLHIEQYAKHVGLIFVNIIQVEYQTDYTKGYVYEQSLIEFNVE